MFSHIFSSSGRGLAGFALGIFLFSCVPTSVAEAAPAIASTVVKPANSIGEFKEALAFTGITFKGASKNLSQRYPYTWALVENQKLSMAAYQALKSFTYEHVSISGRKLDRDSGHKYALALMIDKELVLVERFRRNTHIPVEGSQKLITASKDTCRVRIQLEAQALIFNVKDSQIAASLPMDPMIWHELTDCKNDTSLVNDKISELVAGTDRERPSLIAQFVARIASYKPSSSKMVQIAVTDVTVDKKSDNFLPPLMQSDAHRELKMFIANNFIMQLHKNWGVAVQPYLVDASVIAMQGRFYGNDATYNLTLPKPAYGVSINLRGFGRVLHDENKTGQNYLYATAIDFKVKQLGGMTRNIFESKVKAAASKFIPVSIGEVQEWPAYQEALNILLLSVTREIHDPDTLFHKAQGFSRKQLKQIVDLEKAYKACRI